MTIGIDKIIEDKKEFQRIIMSMSDINEEKYAKYVAAEIYSPSKYKKLSLKYHPDKFGQKNFENVPYVKQMWLLLTSSKDLTMDYVSHVTSYLIKIKEYRSINFWDEEEDKQNLGPIQQRIQRIRDEDNKEYEEKERIRKEKSLKRKEEEEKERIRKEKSLKKKKEEEEDKKRKEKIRREDSIELMIQRRKQFAEDDKKRKKEREEEEEEEEDMQKKRKIDDVEPDMIPEKINFNVGIQEMDVDEQHSRSNKNGKQYADSYTSNKTKRHQNNRKKRIDNFMKNKTVRRRELMEKNRNLTEKMDVVNQFMLPKNRGRTLKRKSAINRVRDFMTP